MNIQDKMNHAYENALQHPSFAPYRHHVGLEFTAANGEKILDYQLLNEKNKAVAIADFTDGVLLRSGSTPEAQEQAFAWIEYCKGLQKNSAKKENN